MQTQVKMRKVDENENHWVAYHVKPLRVFSGVKKHRSVWRAMRRGNVGYSGEVLPSRPFNNSKRTRGRKLQKEFEKASVTLKSWMNKAREIDTENAKSKS